MRPPRGRPRPTRRSRTPARRGPLEVEDPVIGVHTQAREGDPVAPVAVAQFSHVVHSATPRATSSARRVPRTSCTRTPHAPACAESTLTTAVGRSRSVTDAPSGSSAPRNRLRDAPTSTRQPELGEHVEPAEQLPVLLAASSRSRVRGRGSGARVARRRRRGRRPGPRARRAPRPTTSSYSESESIRSEWPRQCMATYRAPVSAATRPIAVVGEPARDVVDDLGAGLDRRERGRRAHGVDADADAPLRRARARPGSPGAAPRRVRPGPRPAASTRPRRRGCRHPRRRARGRARWRHRRRTSDRRR